MKKITTQKISDKYSESYIVYARKSTDDAENQKNSIAYQKQEILRYCEKENLAIAPLDILGFCTGGIIEEHHSGYKQDDTFDTTKDGSITYKVSRPKFLTLVNSLQQRKFRGIICLCWDRLSRNEGDDLLIKKLMSQGTDIRFVQASYDATSAGALHMDIDGMFSRHYSRVISEKVKDSYKKLLAEGKCVYAAPIGYLNEGSDCKPFDPTKAPVVRRVFELYATGEWSYSSLAKWANQNGLISRQIRRKRTKEEKSNGVQMEDIPPTIRPVNEKTIENILNNPFYIGKLMHKGQLIDSKVHQPLIDLSLFYKVRSMLKTRNKSIHYPELSFFTYRGLVECGACNRIYSPYVQKGISYYRSRCKKDCHNSFRNINDKFISEKIVDILTLIRFSDDELAVLEMGSQSALDALGEKRNREVADLQRSQCKILDDISYLSKDKLTLLRTGVYTPQQLIEEEGRLATLLLEARSRMNSYSESARSMLDTIVTFSELVRNASEYFKYGLDFEKRQLTAQVFSKLYIENGEMKYVAKQAYEALLQRLNPQFENSGAPQYVLHELPEITNAIRESFSELKTYMDYIATGGRED